EAMPGLRDHERRAGTQDARGLAEDDLEAPRIVAGACQLARFGRRLDLVEPDYATLGLRDDLVGHTDDVAVLELGAAGDQRGHVVSGHDFGQAFDGEDLDQSRITPPRAASRTA